MPSNPKNLLPSRFPGTVGLSTSPQELFDLLTDLFTRERSVTPQDDYLSYHGSPGSIYFKIQTFNWFLPFLPSSGTFLDWGCNHAPDSCLIRAVFGDAVTIHGCDVRDPEQYQVFAKAASLQYRRLAHHISLPYDDNSFDAVIASGSLEHVVIDYASLQELYRVMKPNGILVITYLPNSFSYHEWYLRHIRKKDFHMRLYTMSGAKMLLKSNGFYPLTWGYTTFFWERRLAAMGIKKGGLLTKLLYTVFPIHRVSGCMAIIAKKVASM